MVETLAERLEQINAAYQAAYGAHYRRMAAFVERIGQLDRRVKPGTPAPRFVIPSHDGRLVRLEDLLGQDTLFLVFIRGAWCDYCHAQVAMLREVAPKFEAAGVRLVVITPETGGLAAQMVTDLELTFPVLCDVDSGVALSYGCLFPVPAEDRAFLEEEGVDLAQYYGSDAWFLPLPAAFAIDSAGQVIASLGGSDFTKRPEPRDMLASVVDPKADPSKD